ncbi:MAG: hypothetical protein Q9160_001428 [Pyrenula sp. 1 TL-2023]
MPICISCSTPVKNLFTTYSKADDRSLGKGVRLTQCPKCKRFADKYVEHDFVVLFIDLVLIKPQVCEIETLTDQDKSSDALTLLTQVYRHLLFNRLGRPDDTLDPSIIRLGILLLLFDVYLTWARIETSYRGDSNQRQSLSGAPILLQYLFFLTLNALATLAHHLTVRFLARILCPIPQSSHQSTPDPQNAQRRSWATTGSSSPEKEDSSFPTISFPPNRNSQNASVAAQSPLPGHASPSAISTALLVSSCSKLFPILLVIWPTDTSKKGASASVTTSFANRARSYVGWAVLFNNLEALYILLNRGYLSAASIAVAGAVARWAVERAVLGTVGLHVEEGPVGDLMACFGWMKSWWDG